MKKIGTILLLLLLGLSQVLPAQSKQVFWTDVAEAAIPVPKKASVGQNIAHYRTLAFDLDQLRAYLSAAPRAGEPQAQDYAPTLYLPMPDGSMEAFAVYESPVLMPGLAVRYPEIRSFQAVSLRNAAYGGRFDYSPRGLHGVLRTPGGEVFLEPYAKGQDRYHIAYYTHEVDPSTLSAGFTCGAGNLAKTNDLEAKRKNQRPAPKNADTAVSLRTYRLALAGTSSYAAQNGGTKSSVLAAMNTAINLVNALTQRELAIRLQIIERNDTLIYLDPDTDPYVNSSDVSSLLSQNTNVITQVAGISGADFDIGHVFTGACSGTMVGVAAPRSACTVDKARGVTCFEETIDYVLRNILVHELGHQFGALHSWNNCPSFIDQRASGSAYEPGGGSTIMAYGGSCGDQNLQSANDAYFHSVSLEEIFQFTRTGAGGECPETTPTDNIEPEVSLPYESGFHIPIQTPFELTAAATDANSDTLTYCWEQYDLGPIAPLDAPGERGPLFRSFPPTPNAKRTFPRLFAILNNTTDLTEQLPSVSRTLTFRCTVRDNHPQAGGIAWTALDFQSDQTAGPFLVTHPNAAETTWEAGEFTEVTWDVANTDNDRINCRYVNILLSVDGGQTFPFVLAENAPNDGSARVTVPDAPTQNARLRIEAADNIFFNLSDADFAIAPATRPGFTLTTAPYAQQVCLPASALVQLSSASILDFQESVRLKVIDGLPAGATHSFSANPVQPGEGTSLQIDLADVSTSGRFDVTIRAVAAGVDTVFRTVTLDLVSNDFSDQQLAMPPKGTNGVGLTTDFAWTPSVHARSYDFELSNTPTFDSVIIRREGLLIDTLRPEDLRLRENTIHYWRIRPRNECGAAGFSDPATFRTEAVACEEINSTDVPQLISGSGRPTVESTIEVTADGVITDVNIPLIKGSYQPVNSLRISLISPAGTEVVLFDKNCGTTLNIRMGFDDEAPEALKCPPDDGIVFQPNNPLSVFDGENARGTWTLRFQVVETGFGGGGSIDEWQLEFCRSITPQDPFVVTNDTLPVLPANSKTIDTDYLETGDDDNGPAELQYILLRPPARGVLQIEGEILRTGDTFTQADINARMLRYLHQGDAPEYDDFTFLVDDGAGGWLPTQTFHIRMDRTATSTRERPVTGDLRFFPNPASDELWIIRPEPAGSQGMIRIYNLQGQLLMQQPADRTTERLRIDISGLTDGLYVISLQTEGWVRTGKVIVGR